MPWDKYGALLTIVVIVLYIVAEFLLPWNRRRKLHNPCNAYFHIRQLGLGKLSYALQDDDAHKVKALVLPSNSVVDIEVAYVPRVNFKVEETCFGFEGDPDSKPAIEGPIDLFVAKGKLPAAEDYWDRNGYYHYRPPKTGRSLGSCYTKGFRVQTKEPGVYKAFLGFLTDEIDGNVDDLQIVVEEKPATRMRCIEHWGCQVRPTREPKIIPD